MTSYPFIQDLFTNVLKASKAIQGRLVVCPKMGAEINSDEFGQVLQDVFDRMPAKKYPVALLMPPRSSFSTKAEGWEKYRFVMFFLKTTYADSQNQVITPNRATGTSMHTIPMDWHDMKRCAVSFIRVLAGMQRTTTLAMTAFRLGADDPLIDPVSQVGKDNLSGVRLEFTGSVYAGCEIEDFNPADISLITVPALDSHPEHKM